MPTSLQDALFQSGNISSQNVTHPHVPAVMLLLSHSCCISADHDLGSDIKICKCKSWHEHRLYSLISFWASSHTYSLSFLYAGDLSHIADKTQNLFKLCNIGWSWHMCDGFNFVTVRSHAICTYNVANALYSIYVLPKWILALISYNPMSFNASAQLQDGCFALFLLLHKQVSPTITTTPSWAFHSVDILVWTITGVDMILNGSHR